MSGKSADHLSRILAECTALSKRMLARWDNATGDALQQQYGPKRLLSDLFGFWGDVGTGAAYLLELAKGDYPTVRFKLTKGDTAAVKVIMLPATIVDVVGTVLTPTDIVPVGGAAGPKIPAKQVLPKAVDGGDSLSVELVTLDLSKFAGQYAGKVFDGNSQIVAYIELSVTS